MKPCSISPRPRTPKWCWWRSPASGRWPDQVGPSRLFNDLVQTESALTCPRGFGAEASMNIWQDPDLAARLDGQTIDVEGWVYPLGGGPGAARYFALVGEAPCCLGCLPRDPSQRVEV